MAPDSPSFLSRRTFLSVAASSTAGVLAACSLPGIADPKIEGNTRLGSRPGTPTNSGPLGLRRLGLGGDIDGSVYVPASYSSSTPAPLVLLLHGAGGSAADFITPFIAEADQTGHVLLAVDSRKASWDFVGGTFGPDIAFIDNALVDTFSRYRINAQRVAVGGFSDGATMSLAVGLSNGDLFSHVVAWTPGALIDTKHRGVPKLFVSHGSLDAIFPVGPNARAIVNELRKQGYQVEYREFSGAHVLPTDIMHESMLWMATS
jgi:predicted esterase